MQRNSVTIASSVILLALAAVLAFAPVDYVTWRPGGTVNVLGSQADGSPLIEVGGYGLSNDEGTLLMTTVATTSVDGSVSFVQALLAYADTRSDAIPRDVVYPPGRSDEQVRSESAAAMSDSRDLAAVAALVANSEVVQQMPKVLQVSANSPAFQKLQPGDLIMRVDDNDRIRSGDEMRSVVQSYTIGDEVELGVLRGGAEETVTVTVISGSEGKPAVGVTWGTGYRHAPVTNRVGADVGGPSAGLVFALAVYERITPDLQLIGKYVVAGTGEIDAAGAVRPIGGVREKLFAAERDGAQIFLFPEANCADLGSIDTDVRLVPVANLKKAIQALQQANESGLEGLESCG